MNSHPKAPSKEEALLALEAIESWASSPALDGVRLFIEATPEPNSKAPDVSEWQLVPMEPDDAMVKAWQDVPIVVPPGTSDEDADRVVSRLVWRAMLAAAPQPPLAQKETPMWVDRAKERLKVISRFTVGSDLHLLEMALSDYERANTPPLAAEKQEAGETELWEAYADGRKDQAEEEPAIWRSLCEGLLDVWDDGRLNPPEVRTYVDGALRSEFEAVRIRLVEAKCRDETQIIERCRAAGVTWIDPIPDDDGEVGYPGGFDMCSMEEMRALLESVPAKQYTGFDSEIGWMMEAATEGELAAYDVGAYELIPRLQDILSGKDDGAGVSREPWESIRRELIALVAQAPPQGLSEVTFDTERFYDALERCVKARGKSWMKISRETNVRVSVLVRLGQGRKPDLASLDALCSWAGLNAADYSPRRELQDRPPPTHLSGVPEPIPSQAAPQDPPEELFRVDGDTLSYANGFSRLATQPEKTLWKKLAGLEPKATGVQPKVIVMDEHEHTRKAFEDSVFNRRFRASIQRNPSPPKGFGGLDFVSIGCPTQAELCKRDADGEYADETVSVMWWGWQAALTRGVAQCPGLDERAATWDVWHEEFKRSHGYAPGIGDAWDAAYRAAWKRATAGVEETCPACKGSGEGPTVTPACNVGPSDEEIDKLWHRYQALDDGPSCQPNHRGFAREVLAKYGAHPTDGGQR